MHDPIGHELAEHRRLLDARATGAAGRDHGVGATCRTDLGKAVRADGIEAGPAVRKRRVGEPGQAGCKLRRDALEEARVDRARVPVGIGDPLDGLLAVQPCDQLPRALVPEVEALLARARGGALPAEEILIALLGACAAIWPGREKLDGVPLGDVWTHSRFGRVPFHKLSQWLAYSLIEPLEQAGVRVTDIDALTGLPEYRNGGLFVDGGVLVARHPAVLGQTHAIGSDVIIEWRALTVALLDRIAEEMRQVSGLTAAELPLGKVLEAGTWRAGRILALEKRADGGPPIQIVSDGTVF